MTVLALIYQAIFYRVSWDVIDDYYRSSPKGIEFKELRLPDFVRYIEQNGKNLEIYSVQWINFLKIENLFSVVKRNFVLDWKRSSNLNSF